MSKKYLYTSGKYFYLTDRGSQISTDNVLKVGDLIGWSDWTYTPSFGRVTKISSKNIVSYIEVDMPHIVPCNINTPSTFLWRK
jgi:hypothetical protein